MWVKHVLASLWKRLLYFFKGLERKEKMRIHPTFQSSFIQYWLCQDWSQERWLQEFEMMQNITIHEIILQSVVDTKAGYAVYPTKIKGYSYSNIDMLETALSTADQCGMKVRVGLGFNDEWWSIDTYDPEWLEEEAEINRIIATEIQMMYSKHPSFAGWYIPHEFNPLMAMTVEQQTNLNQFYRKIAGAIKFESSHTIMTAPFYNAFLSEPLTMALWSYILYYVFKDTRVGILALQDSVGAGFNTVGDLDEIYAATRKATNEMNIKLYAVTETFQVNVEKKENLGGKFSPASQRQIEKQLVKVAPYVQGYVAFSLNHYQNRNIAGQATGYDEYYRYTHN